MEQIIDKTISLLKLQNLDSFEVNISKSNGTSTSIHLGEIENLQQYQNQDIDIAVYINGRSGSASSVDLSTTSIEKSIKKAINIAKYTQIDKFNTLAPKELLAFNTPDLDLFYPWELTTSEALQILKECEDSAMSVNGITNSSGVEISSFSGTSWYINSNDLIASTNSTNHSIYCSLIAEKNNEKQTSYKYSSVIDHKDLINSAEIGKIAATNTLNKLDSKLIKSGNYPVIFTNKTSSGIISNILSAISGGSQYKKSTFLAGSLNKIITSKNINIIEDPLVRKTMGVRAYDSDGVLKKHQYFIKNGVVQNYIMGQYSANQMQMKTTGNSGGVNNIVVPATRDMNLGSLIKYMDNGIIVDELMGQGVNSITGDYSRAAGGFLVKNGKIIHRISGITIAGNLKQMIKDIEIIADDKDPQKNIKVGSILIKNMVIAGL